jgi:hypothetical protein
LGFGEGSPVADADDVGIAPAGMDWGEASRRTPQPAISTEATTATAARAPLTRPPPAG